MITVTTPKTRVYPDESEQQDLLILQKAETREVYAQTFSGERFTATAKAALVNESKRHLLVSITTKQDITHPVKMKGYQYTITTVTHYFGYNLEEPREIDDCIQQVVADLLNVNPDVVNVQVERDMPF
jgi:hypothetical protein